MDCYLLPVLVEMYSFLRASRQQGLSRMVVTTSLLPWMMAITMAFLPATSVLVREAPFSTSSLGGGLVLGWFPT